jgi:hypothetical protein
MDEVQTTAAPVVADETTEETTPVEETTAPAEETATEEATA